MATPVGGDALAVEKGDEPVKVNFDEVVHDAGTVTNGDGSTVWLVPLWAGVVDAAEAGDLWSVDEDPVQVNAVDLELLGFEPCDVVAEYTAFVEEVPMSRLNLGRAPLRVLHQQYAEVTAMLSGADIGFDAAGRLTANSVAIDSSPMNQSIFYELLMYGMLEPKDKKGVPTGASQFYLGTDFDALEIAAMALGVAADKTTPISIDTVAYLNRIYGITDFGPPGEEEFYDFSGFSYNRAATYKGCFSGLVINGGTADEAEGYFLTHEDEDGNVNVQEGFVFDGNATATGITGFALWADDARRVNLFIHDNVILPENTDAVGTAGLCDVFFPPTIEMPESVQRLLPDSDLMPIEDTAPPIVVVIVDDVWRGRGRAR